MAYELGYWVYGPLAIAGVVVGVKVLVRRLRHTKSDEDRGSNLPLFFGVAAVWLVILALGRL